MKIPFVDLAAQYESIKDQIGRALNEVFADSRFIGGSKVEQFENELSSFVKSQYCVSCANGTDALEIALLALGIGKGAEVIVPAISWVSTASAVHTVGAKPVFADILPDTYTIDPKSIKELITENTQAIIPVHLYGQLASMNDIMALAKANDLFVIEDAAQAIGASQDGKMAGQFGDIATFSFYPGKNIGAYGDAGAIVTNESVFANSCRILGNLGQKEHHNHVALGRNSKLDSMQAAILSVKMKFAEKWNLSRRNIAKKYDELLSDLPIQLPHIDSMNVSNYHLYVIQVPNRNKVIKKMAEAGVSCQIHYPKALPDLLPLKNIAKGDFPVARQHANSCLSLPIYPEMTKEQTEYVSEALHNSI